MVADPVKWIPACAGMTGGAAGMTGGAAGMTGGVVGMKGRAGNDGWNWK